MAKPTAVKAKTKVPATPIKEAPPKDESESDDEEEEDEEAKEWWAQANIDFVGKGEKRWDTLEHNGVLFPDPYVPHGVPIYYDGVEFKLTPEEEEVATFFAAMKQSDYYRKDIFRKNFFMEWRAILDKRGAHPIRILELVDFDPIYNWWVADREKIKNRTKEEKKKIQEALKIQHAPFKTCLWNGKREEVANFRVEPPGLFRGRGTHPKSGRLKKRIQPEDVIINIGKEAKVPEPPAGHKWGEVRHDNTVTWLAMFKDSVNGNHKYVMLAANSAVKGMSDMMKFEKARNVKNHIDNIRESYRAAFKSKSLLERQRAVCTYFIDKLALRVGNEKNSEEEADTVGCCSLRVSHVTPGDNNTLHFDFLGKDSIKFENTVEVDPTVYQLICEFRRNKHPQDDIFSEVTPTGLNDYLKGFMPGLTAKVFRTYNASICLQQYFVDHPLPEKMSDPEKLVYFNTANTQVAILCNHQRTVAKGHASKMAQMDDKISNLKKLVERLEAIKSSGLSYDKAAKKFFEGEDKVQYDWLGEYGTPEQKEEYDKIVAARGDPKSKRAPTATQTKATSSAAKTVAKQAPAKRGRGVKEEEESSDDELLANIATPASKKGTTAAPPKKAAKPEPKKAAKPEPKKAAKPAPKKGKKSVKDEDSDDEKIGNL